MAHRNITYSQFSLGNQLTQWKRDVNTYNKKRKETIDTVNEKDPYKRTVSVKQQNLKKNIIKSSMKVDNDNNDQQTKGQKYRFSNVNEDSWKDEIQLYAKEKNFFLKKQPQQELLIIKEAFKPINPIIPRKIKG